jgi:hypothetical protein
LFTALVDASPSGRYRCEDRPDGPGFEAARSSQEAEAGMTKSVALGATIVALGLAANGYLAGGRYALTQIEFDQFVRLDRWTGNVENCVINQARELNCEWLNTFTADVKSRGSKPGDQNSR